MILALAISLILVAVVLMVSRGSGGPSASERRIDPDQIPELTQPVGEVRDLRDTPAFGASTNATVKLKDRNDPTRVAWQIQYDAVEPAADGEASTMVAPRVWYYIDEKTAVYIRSDTAELVMPDATSEPESGRFEGNVELVQVDRLADGSLPPADSSGVRLTTAWLVFDAIAGEIRTTEPVRVTGERVVADCQGLSVVLNEVDERIEFFEVPGGLVATVTPPPASDESDSDPAGETAVADSTENQPATARRARGSGGDSTATATADETPVIQYYAATFSGDVVVSQPNRRISSDRARMWIRLEDNSLAGGSSFSSAAPKRVLPLEAALLSLAMASQPDAGSGDSDELGFDEPIEFRCTGRTTVLPMADRPAPLGSGDDMALRFEVDEGGRVRFEDDAIGAEGDADQVEYTFNSKLLTLTGTEDAPTRTVVSESGTLHAEMVTLGLSTGVGQAKGVGRLESVDGESGVAWRDQADVVFRVRDGWMTGSLEQAIASGGVELREGESRVSAMDLNARFAEAGERSPIERVVLAGGVQARTERGELTSDRVDVRFDVVDGESEPRLAIATGSVHGTQDGQRVWADQIEAGLVQTDEGETEVSTALANGSVRYERGEGTYAVGETAHVDASARTAVIEGSPGVVASGEATIESERILLDDGADMIETPGRGRLTITDAEGTLTRVRATWTESMRYSDTTGQLDVVGDVDVVSTPTPVTRDTFRGHRLFAIVERTPEDESSDDGSSLGSDRRLVSAVATGEVSPASAEFLRFANPGDESPVRVTAILGQTIEADNAAGVLRVPGSGRLVVSDERVDAGEESVRGAALFDWDGQMDLDRSAGRATMVRGVRMVHRPLDERRSSIELECERLDSAFEGSGSVARLTDSTAETDLLEVEASGAVWARSGEQQMLSDVMLYDPATSVATATAAGGGWVTLFNQSRAAPITAAELLWNLDSGRIDVVRPSPVSVPR